MRRPFKTAQLRRGAQDRAATASANRKSSSEEFLLRVGNSREIQRDSGSAAGVICCLR